MKAIFVNESKFKPKGENLVDLLLLYYINTKLYPWIVVKVHIAVLVYEFTKILHDKCTKLCISKG